MEGSDSGGRSTGGTTSNDPQPDYYLKVKVNDREDKATTLAGAAWVKQDGVIRLRLDPGITLRWNDDLILTLFPNRKKR